MVAEEYQKSQGKPKHRSKKSAGGERKSPVIQTEEEKSEPVRLSKS